MPVRDVLWACPGCRTPGTIRPVGRIERCSHCNATFRRGRGATIVMTGPAGKQPRPTSDWLRELGPPRTPEPRPDGVVLGSEPVKVKFAMGQVPLTWGTHMLGWVEKYSPKRKGELTLRTDGLHLDLGDERFDWAPGDVTGLQPASSSIQLAVGPTLVSIKFTEGSVRLWTRAVADMLHIHHRSCGREIVELQPFVRTRELQST